MGIFNRKKAFCDHISIQGYSHKKIGKECQDNSDSWEGNGYCGIIVCDGHGGDKYIRSAIGSRLACEIGKENISAFMGKFDFSNTTKIDSALEQLEKSIVSSWYSAVEADYSANPVTEDDRFNALSGSDKNALIKNPIKAYGSTFIAAVKTNNYCFVLKLGDGNTIFFYSDGSNEMPQELEDEDCQFNITTSLCNNDAALSFHHCFRKFDKDRNVTGIVLTSDGVINCYKTEENYISFMQNVYFGYGEDDVETAREDLRPALEKLSEKGSGDDLSVAIIREPLTDKDAELIKQKQEAYEAEKKAKDEEKSVTNGEEESLPKKPLQDVYQNRGNKKKITLFQEITFFGKKTKKTIENMGDQI